MHNRVNLLFSITEKQDRGKRDHTMIYREVLCRKHRYNYGWRFYA